MSAPDGTEADSHKWHTGKGKAQPKRRSRLRDLQFSLFNIPPERRDRPPVVLASPTCCCCCCCCLHSVGSLVGAAVASAPGTGRDREAKLSAAAKYWLSVLFAAFVAALVTWGVGVGDLFEDLFLGSVVIALVVLGVQLAASLVACIAIDWSSRPDKKTMFKKVGIITLGTITGAAVGTVGTIGLFFLIYDWI